MSQNKLQKKRQLVQDLRHFESCYVLVSYSSSGFDVSKLACILEQLLTQNEYRNFIFRQEVKVYYVTYKSHISKEIYKNVSWLFMIPFTAYIQWFISLWNERNISFFWVTAFVCPHILLLIMTDSHLSNKFYTPKQWPPVCLFAEHSLK